MPSVKPRRNYRAVIESLRQVWKIETLTDQEAVWSTGTANQPHFDSAKPLRVCVWNMCKGAGGMLFEHDLRVLMYGADLLLAQEALMSERSLQAFRQPGFEVVHGASYKRSDGLRDGVMTMARATVREPVCRIICKYPEPVLKTPKAALVTCFEWGGVANKVMVVNLHATLVRSKKGAVDEISHLMEQLPPHAGPMILAGDFNTFTRGYLEAVTQRLHDFKLNLVPIADDPRGAGGALDQLYIRGFTVKNVVIDTTIKNSDHFPLIAELLTDDINP